MTTKRSISFKHRYLGFAALLIAPAMLGARGCHVAVVGSECGGLRGEACDRGQFCDFEPDAQCGAADRTGSCENLPEVCTEEYAPVCGCDGQTYGTACAANAAGVSVASDGECEQPGGETCGGLLGLECNAGQFCDFALDATCGAADQTGVCSDIPVECTLEFNPVCGCDGNTYGNDCSANSAGVSVARRGECESPSGEACAGLLGLQCGDGEFCNFAPDAFCGAADQTGTCTLRPEVCDTSYDPVCGCDGNTYGNDCSANSAGVSVVRRGECEPPPSGEACGGLLGLQCGDGQFCAFAPDAFCGAADQTGICTDIPQACTREFNPVCGCDGVTHANPCIASSAGTSVASQGECEETPPPSGEVCGGLLGAQCGEAEFCAFAADAFCGAADATGVCTRRPEVCTQQFDPVCGCDGQTYGNACSAASLGISVASDGECEPVGSVCGGLLGAQCGQGEFCDFPPGAFCGAADQTGTCRPVPEVCQEIFDPVCGCNDVTFANSCTANAAGVSVASTGECP